MSKVILGLIAGIIFGALDVGLMLPMSFPEKTTALLGAFASRFAIGFVTGEHDVYQQLKERDAGIVLRKDESVMSGMMWLRWRWYVDHRQ